MTAAVPPAQGGATPTATSNVADAQGEGQSSHVEPSSSAPPAPVGPPADETSTGASQPLDSSEKSSIQQGGLSAAVPAVPSSEDTTAEDRNGRDSEADEIRRRRLERFQSGAAGGSNL